MVTDYSHHYDRTQNHMLHDPVYGLGDIFNAL